MNYLSIFFVSFCIALSGALVPGPLLTLVISESTKRGFKSGPLVIAGHAIIEVLMVLLIVLGFSKFIAGGNILKIIAIFGSLILIYFAIDMFRSIPGLSIDVKTNSKPSGNLTLLGVTSSLANPYWSIWWLSIGMGLLLSAKNLGVMGVAIFFLGHILADLGFYSVVSFSMSRGRKFLSLKIYKAIIFSCALTLLIFGLFFLKKYL